MYEPDETVKSLPLMQQHALDMLVASGLDSRQIGIVLGCSANRATRLRKGDAVMTVIEYANAVHYTGREIVPVGNLPLVREPSPAPSTPSRPVSWVNKPRKRLDPKTYPEHARTAASTSNTRLVSTIAAMRGKLMQQVPLPAPREDDWKGDPPPLPELMMMALRDQHAQLAARVGGATPELTQAALCSYCAQLSMALAKALCREFPGPGAFELERYYDANPDALQTPYDAVTRIGGHYKRVDALVLHQQAVMQMIAET